MREKEKKLVKRAKNVKKRVKTGENGSTSFRFWLLWFTFSNRFYPFFLFFSSVYNTRALFYPLFGVSSIRTLKSLNINQNPRPNKSSKSYLLSPKMREILREILRVLLWLLDLDVIEGSKIRLVLSGADHPIWVFLPAVHPHQSKA